MRKLFAAAILMALLWPISANAQVRVDGHWKDTNHDGVKDTYVQPYQRTAPDNSLNNNYNSPGNYNPNTGRVTPQHQPYSAPALTPYKNPYSR